MTSCSAGTSGLAPSFKDSEYAKEVAVSLKAVRSAAFLTTGVQKGLKQSQETSQKADDSPVTVADYAAQAVVSWWALRDQLHCPDLAKRKLAFLAEPMLVSHPGTFDLPSPMCRSSPRRTPSPCGRRVAK